MKIGFLDTKNSTGPHRGILGTKKPAEAGIEEFWAQKNRQRPASRNFGHKKKPAEAGCVDGAP